MKGSYDRLLFHCRAGITSYFTLSKPPDPLDEAKAGAATIARELEEIRLIDGREKALL